MENKENIRALTHEDAAVLAGLHMKAFPDFFLSSLGENFLKVFYKIVLTSSKGFGSAAFIENKLIGFAVGTVQTKGFYRDLVLYHGFELFIPCLGILLKQPGKIFRILNNLKKSSSGYDPEEGGWLLSICTNPDFWGKHFSSGILKKFEEEADLRDMKKIWLTTDHTGNERANSFYLKFGYKLFSTFVNSNERKMNLYVKEISSL